MYYVVDMEYRAIRCYRDMGKMWHANEEVAKTYALKYQEESGNPHQVIPAALPVTSSLRRIYGDNLH